MPIPAGDDGLYASLEQLRDYLDIEDSDSDAQLTDALVSVSREIDDHCNRTFRSATVATARVFQPFSEHLAFVDDFYTTDGLVIEYDAGADGTYSTAWTVATDVQLEPLNGVVGGAPGWPYWRLRTLASSFAISEPRGRASLRITAKWGWADVPDPVYQSCLILASETFKLATAPFGVAGFGEFGVVRVRDNPLVEKKLRKYVRDAVLVA